MYATKIYRAGNYFYEKNFKFISKFFYILNMALNNCDIPSKTRIEKGSHFGHGGIGVVINANSIIGKNVLLGQGITVGGRNGIKEVPIIEDNVYIGPGARILGNIKIGTYSIIGANSVVVKNVPDFSIVVGVPGKIIGRVNKDNFEKYKDYFISGQNPF